MRPAQAGAMTGIVQRAKKQAMVMVKGMGKSCLPTGNLSSG
jgi:hypothetical protein